MEKYDRDVEQKQRELDVLKVCISYFMLVSKRSACARALFSPPTPPPPPRLIALAMLAIDHFRVALKPLFQSEAKSERSH